ncbi:MAG: hypothetical protein ACRCWC_04225 [Plesiomonas shigelloides]
MLLIYICLFAFGVFALFEVVRRVDLMHPSSTALFCVATYLVVGGWVLWAVVNVARGEATAHESFGLVGVAMYMAWTRGRWVGSIPEIARRKDIFFGRRVTGAESGETAQADKCNA